MGRRREGNNDSRRYIDWLERAGEDMLAAERLLGSDDTLNVCAFHCQQCIEKALKGYLIFKTHKHLDGHNLTWLCRQAIKVDSRFIEWLDESVALNRYYIETRYPADLPLELTGDTVKRACDMARSMYNFICNEIDNAPEKDKLAAAENASWA